MEQPFEVPTGYPLLNTTNSNITEDVTRVSNTFHLIRSSAWAKGGYSTS
jgi:hypothetical protein